MVLLLQLHGKTYFRLEHYLSASVLDKLNQSTVKEELSKLHSNYYEASDAEAEFQFLKVRRMIVCLSSMNQLDEPLGLFSAQIFFFFLQILDFLPRY